MIGKLVLTIAGGCLFGTVSFTQTTQLTFDVASIRQSKTDDPWFWDLTPGGRLVARNCTLKRLIVLAYRVQEFQVVGGPAWVSKDQFDIEAKPDSGANPTDEQSRQMLRALLEQRFQLTLRKETKRGPVYILTVIKNGPPLSANQSAPVEAPPTPDVQTPRGAMRMTPGSAFGMAVPISLLARFLGQTLGRPVIDKTGLKGRYDINVHWTPEQAQRDLPVGAQVPEADGPSLFTAFREQVGLKLESGTGLVDEFVILRAEKPSQN